MSYKKTVRSCLEKYSAQFFEAFARAEASPDKKNIHDLRTSVKKLRAFYRINEYCGKGFDEERTYAPLRPLFKKAGIIREAEINKSQLSHWKPDKKLQEQIAHSLEAEKEKAEKEFSALLERTDREKLFRHLINAVEHGNKAKIKKIKKTGKKFIDREFKKIKKDISLAATDPLTLHHLRKHLKIAGYILNAGLVPAKSKALADLKNIQKEAGLLHDRHRMELFLKRFAKKKGHNKDISQLLFAIEKQNKKNAPALLKQVKETVKQFT